MRAAPGCHYILLSNCLSVIWPYQTFLGLDGLRPCLLAGIPGAMDFLRSSQATRRSQSFHWGCDLVPPLCPDDGSAGPATESRTGRARTAPRIARLRAPTPVVDFPVRLQRYS